MKFIYYTCLIAFATLTLFTSCTDESDQLSTPGEPVNVRIALSSGFNLTTRLTTPQPEELMHRWIVVVTNTSNVIEKVIQSQTYDGTKVEDAVNVELTTGTKRFYSFSNLALHEITYADTLPATGTALTLRTTYSTPANGTIPATGMPMSNLQEIYLSNRQGQTIDLLVKRMMAKVMFNFGNATTSAIALSSITIDQITKAGESLSLLPPAAPQVLGAEPYTHTLSTPYTVEPSTSLSSDYLTFYINESILDPTQLLSSYQLIIRRKNLSDESNPIVDSYALLNTSWGDFARNSLSLIPIVFEDYTLKLKVVDYPPIGVYPAGVVQDEKGGFTCTFNGAGYFSITPIVTKNSSSTATPYTFVSWKLINSSANIFLAAPQWEETTQSIFGSINDVKGTAHYQLKVRIDKGDDVTFDLLYNLYITRK